MSYLGNWVLLEAWKHVLRLQCFANTIKKSWNRLLHLCYACSLGGNHPPIPCYFIYLFVVWLFYSNTKIGCNQTVLKMLSHMSTSFISKAIFWIRILLVVLHEIITNDQMSIRCLGGLSSTWQCGVYYRAASLSESFAVCMPVSIPVWIPVSLSILCGLSFWITPLNSTWIGGAERL
jgi:hypothetical protein